MGDEVDLFELQVIEQCSEVCAEGDAAGAIFDVWRAAEGAMVECDDGVAILKGMDLLPPREGVAPCAVGEDDCGGGAGWWSVHFVVEREAVFECEFWHQALRPTG